MVNLSLEMPGGMLPSKRRIHERQLFEDEDLRFVRLEHLNLHLSKPEEPQEDYSKGILDLKIIKMTLAIVIYISFAVILKAGHVGQSFGNLILLTLN